jgi:hypothetical protein
MAEDKRVSRRELLRTVGLAGVAAWAAPILTSTRASASVDRCTKKKALMLCEGIPCDCFSEFPLCGTCSSDVGDGSFCFARYADLKCYCGEDVFCSETHTCTSDADCSDFAPGLCITKNGCTDCGPGEITRHWGICTKRCCTPYPGPAPVRGPRRLGKTAAGR